MSYFRQSGGVKPMNVDSSSQAGSNRRHSFSTAVGTVARPGTAAKVPLRNRGSRLSPALPSVSTDNASSTGTTTHAANVARRRTSLDKVSLIAYYNCYFVKHRGCVKSTRDCVVLLCILHYLLLGCYNCSPS